MLTVPSSRRLIVMRYWPPSLPSMWTLKSRTSVSAAAARDAWARHRTTAPQRESFTAARPIGLLLCRLRLSASDGLAGRDYNAARHILQGELRRLRSGIQKGTGPVILEVPSAFGFRSSASLPEQ